ncbi:MAG: SPOR domain-containing protein [Bacteroidota bacterium]
MRTLLTILILIVANNNFAQETNITEPLKLVESGNIQKAESLLKEYKLKSSNDPSVIFLDAVLTKNGEEALQKYSIVYEKYPKSNYADASLYRIFSYHYSLGYYKKAETYLTKLKTEYPNSPYIKTADRNIPDELLTEEVLLPPAADSKNYRFTIQAGAFINIDNAKKLGDQIKANGYTVEITQKEIGGTILNVVNVGKFVNEEETKSVLDFLSEQFKIKGRMVQLIN